MQRVILTTGGTGGHIFPALAVAEELRELFPHVRILFVGGQRGPEAGLAAKAGLEFSALPVRPVLGKGLQAVTAGFWMLAGLGKALSLHKHFKPQVVLGLGGYAAFAQVLAAVLRRTPTAVHEQNSVPGLANRVLGRLVNKVLVSFPDRKGWFPHRKVRVCGNPVRRSIREMQAPLDKAPGKRLLVLGGSQGAVAVNSAVIAALPRLAAAGVSIRHQTGERDFERVETAYKDLRKHTPLQAEVRPFFEDMADVYRWGDLALCRAGASTVFELAAAGLPAVFIPFPFATHNHQTENARFLADNGAAVLLEQKDLEHQDLAALLLKLFDDHQGLERMRSRTLQLGRPEAARCVALALADLCKDMRQ